MDLRTHYPRSLNERLGGYVHLGRMIDKCRAVLAGTQGDYIFPCPLDRQLLEFSGLTADQFLEAAKTRSDEKAIIDWFVKTAKPQSEGIIKAWNEAMLGRGPDAEEKWAYFRKTRDAIDPTRTDITTWADLLDLEEKRPVPARNTANR
ncbi:MAG: DUF5069 domain-containing protein [Nitrospiraceae bacterium]